MMLMKCEQHHGETKGDTKRCPSAAMPFLLLFLFMSIIFSGFIIFISMLFIIFVLFKKREQESRQVRQIIQTGKQKPDISARF